MRIEGTLAGLRAALDGEREVGFVPTMGNLHAGHIALVHEARRRVGANGTVVASIFVNRLQFGPSEDFDRYPRTFERDAGQLRDAGCDLLFAPDETVMYPEPQTFKVIPDPALASILEGGARQGHFDGVCTVVMKLFSMVRPRVAVFGRKDYQQLMLIRRMAEQFALPLEIVPHDTVREADGLAMSSRNGYLGVDERTEAPNLNRILRGFAESVRTRRRAGANPTASSDPDALSPADVAALEAAAIAELVARGWQPDYVTLRRQRDLLPADPDELRGSEPLVVLAAAKLGTPRLLDNIEI